MIGLLGRLAVVGLLLAGAGAVAAPDDGEGAFVKHCARCHLASGAGALPWYPALEALAQRLEPEAIARTILSGQFRRGGEIAGHTIPIMPAWDWLSDADVAAIVNYIEARWGQTEVSITALEVQALRRGVEVEEHGEGQAELERRVAEGLYFEHCVGCHGAGRLGASGPPLPPWLLDIKSTGAVLSMVHYGSSEGMPGWGVADKLTAKQIEMLAAYLIRPATGVPPFTLDDARGSWTVEKPTPQHSRGRARE